MRKRLSMFFAILTVAVTVMARPVDQSTASKVAQAFLKAVSGKAYVLTDITSQTPFHEFYVFSLPGDNGYVLVSGDDCVVPILGYSLNNTFAVEGMPAHVRDWMDVYEEQIVFYRERYSEQAYGGSQEVRDQWNNLEKGIAPLPPLATAVSPLVTTQWNQSPYYNNYCPYDNTYSERTVTGCVATAAAQVMKYWNHPATGYGSHSYTHSTYGTMSADFGATSYNWSSMPTSLSSSSSTAQVNAVATLMYHIGVAVEMDYGPGATGGSAAFSGSRNLNTPAANNAFVNYFKYKPTLHYELKADYTEAQWSAMLQADLNSGHPILYSGRDPSGGHAFVCDGYNNQGQFHFNWGWGGSYDGYYTMGDLHPGTGGTGGNSTYTFNLNNSAILGIEPMTSWSTSASTTVNASATNTSYGSVTGGGTYNFADTITIRASANTGCRFYQWSDGSVQNPRKILATGGAINVTANIGPLSGDTLGYCSNGRQTSLGNGSGNCYWGIKMPGSVVTSGHVLTAVEYYLSDSGTYDLTIYTGTTSPTTAVHTQSFTLTDEEAWNTMTLSSPVTIPSDQNFWITLHDNGVAYPCSYSFSSGNADGVLWGSSFGSIMNSGWDVAFMIRGIFTDSGTNPGPGPGPDPSGCNVVMTIGDTTSTTTAIQYPVNNYYKYTLSETIIDAAELQGLGQITSISYRYNHTATSTDKNDVTIWIQPTTKTSFASNSDLELLDANTAVMVYSGALNCSQGWNEFQFTTPYNYDGTSNLMIIVDDNSNDYNGNNYTFNTAACSDYKTLTWFSDSQNPDPTNSSYSGTKQYYQARVQMRLKGCEPVPESGDVTVADGTDNSEYVPFYGYWADADQHNQMIYPAADLSAMVGRQITQMVFYIDPNAANGSNTSNDRIGTWTVSLGETTATTLSGIDNSTTRSTVYDGYMNFNLTENTMTITFATPYVYNGGNLLVDFDHEEANYNRWYFLGTNSTGSSYTYDEQRNFLPKVTFSYEPVPSCVPPVVVIDSVVDRTMWFSWSSTADSVFLTLINNDAQQIAGWFLSASGSLSVNLPEQYFPIGYVYLYGAAFCGGTDTSAWAYDINFVTCNQESQCPVTIVLNDGYGDGWNGGALDIYDTVSGLIFSSMSCPDHGGNNTATSDTVLVNLCPDRVYSAVYRSGQYDDEVSFLILNSEGDTLINVSDPDAGVQGYFTHTCPDGCTLSLPYTETFEESSATLECWNTDGPGTWQFGTYSSTAATYEGTSYAYIRHATSGNVTKLISPVIHASAQATSLRLTFAHIQKVWAGDQDQMRVYYRTSAEGNWIMAAEYTNDIQTWTVENVMVPANTYQVAFEMTDGYGYGVAVDSVVFTEITASFCFPANNLEVDNVTFASATINWGGAANSYRVTVSDGTNNVYNGVVNDSTLALTGLSAETNYSVSIYAICGAGDTSEVATTTFYTGYCSPNPTSVDGSGITSVSFGGMTNTTSHAGSTAAYVNNSTMAGSVPAGTTATVEITYATGYTYGTVIWVDWNNNLTFEGDEVVYAGTSTNENPTTLAATFDIPVNTTLGSYRMRIVGADSQFDSYVSGNTTTVDPCATYTWGVAEDYTLTVTEVPVCLAPNGLTATPAAFSVALAWNDLNDGSATYSIYNMADTSVVATGITANNYTVTGLNSETTYIFGVVANCTATESSNTVTVTATTLVSCPAPTALSVTLTSGNGTVAELAWTAGGDETAWQICLNGDTNNLIDVTTNPYTLTGLTAEQTYTAKVRAYCSATDQSTWSNTVTFEPTTKHVIGSGNATNNYLPTNCYYNYSLTQQIYTAAELGNAGLIESIDFYCNSTAERTRTLNVYVVSTTKSAFDNSSDWIGVTDADLQYSGSVTFAPQAWTTIALDGFVYDGLSNIAIIVDDNTGSYSSTTPFSAFSASNQALRVYSDGTNYEVAAPTYSGTIEATKNQIRLVKSALSGCVKPTSLSVDYNGGTTATVSWNSTANAFNLDVNGTVISNVTNPYTLTGLNLATDYTVKVQANCGADTSEWTNPVTFHTDNCLPTDQCQITIYAQDSYGDGWNGNAIDVIQNGVTVATYSMASQNLSQTVIYDTAVITVCSGMPISFNWVVGSYAYETSFMIANANGTVVSSRPGSDMVAGEFLALDNCTAMPTLDSMKVTVAVNDATMGTTVPAPGVHYFYEFDTCSVVAVPNNGYHLLGWTLYVTMNDTVVALDTTFAIAVDNVFDLFQGGWVVSHGDGRYEWNVTANFASEPVVIPDTMYVTTSVNDATMGTVLPAPGSHTYVDGDTLILSIQPNPGYYIYQVQMNATHPLYGTNSEVLDSSDFEDGYLLETLVVDSTYFGVMFNLHVIFAAESVTPPQTDSMLVNVAVNDATMGTTIPAPGAHYFYEGDSAHVYAVPNTGYYLEGWSINVVSSGLTLMDTTFNYPVTDVFDIFGGWEVDAGDGDYVWTVTANFAAGAAPVMHDSVIVTTSVNDSTMGTVVPAPGTHYYVDGDVFNFSILPNAGYEVLAVTITESYMGQTETVTLTDTADIAELIDEFDGIDIDEDMYGLELSIHVIFAPVGSSMHTVTLMTNDATMGTVDPAGATLVADGATFTATATALTGNHFVGWYDATGTVVSTNATYVFTVTDDVILMAVFEANGGETYYEVTVSYDQSRGRVDGAGSYVAGSNVSLQAYAFENYEFVAWLDENGDTLSTNTAYAIANLQSNRALTALFQPKTGIADVDMENVKIYSTDNVIVVRGAEGKSVVLFDVNGRMLSREANAAERVEFRVSNSGVYLVKVANAAAKRVVVIR